MRLFLFKGEIFNNLINLNVTKFLNVQSQKEIMKFLSSFIQYLQVKIPISSK